MNDFLTSVFEQLNNKRLNKKEIKVLNFVLQKLFMFENNNLRPPSSIITMLSTSCGLDYPQTIASVINTFGVKHFCITETAHFILNDFKTNKKYFPGFGHPEYKNGDPRVKDIIKFLNENKFKSQKFIKLIKFGLNKKVHPNILGASVAILLDLGCSIHTINYFPIIARMVGFTLIYKKTKLAKIKFNDSIKSINQYNKTYQI